MGIGAATLAIAAVAVIAWLAFLVRNTRVRHRRDLPPPNLTPYLTDDDLETKRLDRRPPRRGSRTSASSAATNCSSNTSAATATVPTPAAVGKPTSRPGPV
jgi:hypothetical protein